MKAPILLLASLGLASPSPHPSVLQRSTNGIQWRTCNEPKLANSTLQCGSLMVPKDYSDPNCEDRIRLDVVKAPATKGPSKGSIFFNFGGPGASGIEDLRLQSPSILMATGQQHDIVSVVPRGTNDTLPFSCYADPVSRTLSTEIIAGDSSDVATGRVWAQSTIFAENCAAVMNETGRFIGSAFSARDIMQVVDAIEPDKMLRFWGISYGTLLGSTLAALFPERVDRMILDGVVNPVEYYQNNETQIFENTDDTFLGFIKGCAANPQSCPLAKNQTAEQVEELLIEFFETLRANPLPIPGPGIPGGGSLFDYSAVKGYFLRQLYFPTRWPNLARAIEATIQGDLVTLLEILDGEDKQSGPTPSFVPQDQESQFGIKCSDVLDSGKGNFTELLPLLEKRRKKSHFFGSVPHETPARCAQWKLPAKERYGGDFKVKTKTGVMLINNSFDPVSPLVSAKFVNGLLEGSSLLHQEGAYGHTTVAQFSTCTAKAIHAYIRDGTLPGPDAKCTVNVPLFTEKTGWEEVLQGAMQ